MQTAHAQTIYILTHGIVYVWSCDLSEGIHGAGLPRAADAQVVAQVERHAMGILEVVEEEADVVRRKGVVDGIVRLGYNVVHLVECVHQYRVCPWKEGIRREEGRESQCVPF